MGTIARRALAILWPAFLSAIVAEGFFFSLFDPLQLSACIVWYRWPAPVWYTAGFFFFWAIGALAGMLVSLLAQGEPICEEGKE